MGHYLSDRDLRPDLVLCSTALRARTTWELAARAIGKKTAPESQYSRNLYHAAPSELLFIIQAVSDDVQRLLVVGHNPGMELLARRLAGSGSDDDSLTRLEAKYPTAGLALFRVTAQSWESLEAGTTCLEGFTIPDDLAQAAG